MELKKVQVAVKDKLMVEGVIAGQRPVRPRKDPGLVVAQGKARARIDSIIISLTVSFVYDNMNNKGDCYGNCKM